MRVLPVVLAGLLILSLGSGVAAAQSQRVSDTIVIQEDETVNGFSAVAGRVVIRGTVQGDLTVFAGRVVIAEGGEVTGRVRAYAGSVQIAGRVGENAVMTAGRVSITETGSVEGSVGVLAGSAVVAGTVGNDVTTLAGSVTLADTADVDGFLTYVGDYTDEGGSVALEARHVSDLSLLPPLTGPSGFVFRVYLLLADIFLGAILIYAFPSVAREAVETMTISPFRVALSGLAAAVIVPLAMLVAAITVIGIPLAIALGMGYLVLLWTGSVYGRYLLGAGLLTFVDKENPYLALVVGIITLSLLGVIPYIGPLVKAIVAIFGVGIIALGGYATYDTVKNSRSL